MNELKNLVSTAIGDNLKNDSKGYTITKAPTPAQAQQAINKLIKPIAGAWQCPYCYAVMAPWQPVCVNCTFVAKVNNVFPPKLCRTMSRVLRSLRRYAGMRK